MSKIQLTTGNPLKGKIGHGQGFIRLETLIDRHKIDTYTNSSSKSYQRFLDKSRTTRLHEAIESKSIEVPTALLLSIRKLKGDYAVIKEDPLNGDIVEIDISKQDLYIVDGQHRFEAYKRTYENNNQDWMDQLIPCTFLLGATQEQERDFFVEINSNTKGVPGNILQELVSSIVEANPDYLKNIKKGDHWKTEADVVMKKLQEDCKIWKNKIKYPGPDGVGVIPNSGFINGLKQLYSERWFAKSLDNDGRVKLLKAFWEGCDLYFEENHKDENPFRESKLQHKYSIQKAVGVSVLHRTIPIIREKMVDDMKSDKIFDNNTWKDYVAIILSENGPEFWRTGKEGEIGSYSSEAGKTILLQRFEDLIMGANL